MRRPLAVLGTLVAALGVAVIGAPGAQAQALAMGQCTTSDNVVLAVDFGHWGGPIVRACGSTPTTGFELLNQGGFRTEGTKHDGPAFICRIKSTEFGSSSAGYPTKDQDACGATPPASAYWSYWHANAGQDTWSYSQLGAMSYKPKPGSVDLWQFGGTNVEGTKGQPTISPDAVRARNASSTGGGDSGNKGGGTPNGGATKRGGNGNGGGASADSRRAAPGKPAATTSAGHSAARSGSAAATTPASTRPGAPSTTAGSAAAAASSGSGSSAPAVIDADPASATPASNDSGSATPVFLGLGLALVLGAGAWFAIRRRRAEPEL